MSKFLNILKIIGYVMAAALIIVVSYALYVIAAYKRIDDHLMLDVVSNADGVERTQASCKTEYTIVTYNIGFGAYSPSYSFFMDGGVSSWAESKASVYDLVGGAGDLILSFNPDFVLAQEVDLDSTRSYHVDEYQILRNRLSEFESDFGINYDSPFLMVPIYQPHGASRAGLSTFSKYKISSAERRSFPVSDGVSKFIDLDRCYTVSRIPVSDGKELILINLHMSAYGSSEKVRDGQTGMLKEEMEREYSQGNYVIVGGDFNHDLKLTEDIPAVSWAHYYDRSKVPEHFSFVLDTFSEKEKALLGDSGRDAGEPYKEESTYTVTLDGFIVSDNIEVTSYDNHQDGFSYSDHQPVVMSFILK